MRCIPTTVLALFGLVCFAYGDIFTVTNTNNSGAGSFRQALLDANSTSGKDTVQFNIAGAGPHTIAHTTFYPFQDEPVYIDGYSQPGSSPNTGAMNQADNADIRIILDCSGVTSESGLVFRNGSSTVRGLNIINYTDFGINLDDFFGGTADSSVVEGCYIGIDVTGTSAAVASGGTPYGVTVRGGTSNNIIGGTSAASRNVIGGNISSGAGVWIEDVGSDSNLVVGNFLGVNKNGTGAVSNFFGVYVTNAAKDNQIGGATLAERNLISGNTGYGVFLQSAGTSGNKVYGNYIGVDISGTSKLQNDVYGVNIDNASGNIVGGAGMGNIISGNVNAGINFNSSASGNIIQGNAIGTNAGGVTNLGNTSTGISFNSTSTNNLIGGTGAGEGNVIAFNGGYGITVVPGCTQNAILGNDFYSNGNIGIDLRSNPFVGGVSANDANDSDTGGNDMQNFPVLTAASVDGGNITVEGTLSTEPGTAGRLYRVEFFGVVTPDGTNFGEGDSYLFGVDVSVNTLGNGTINTTFPGSVAVGAFISATATSPDSNTSEFSQVIEVADGSLPVSLSGFSAQVSGGTVRLSWSTFSETNNAGFELWRKGEQESEYRLVGSYRVDSSLEGLGTSPVGRDYLFEDRTVVAGASYSYRLADVDYNGVVSFHPPLRVMVTEGGPAEGFRLYPNFPNPFNAGTVIQYEVPGGPEDTHALSLNIFNIRGQLVKTLVEDYQAPGSYQVEWKGRDQYGNPIGSGVYFLVMQSGPHRLTRRLVLLQ